MCFQTSSSPVKILDFTIRIELYNFYQLNSFLSILGVVLRKQHPLWFIPSKKTKETHEGLRTVLKSHTPCIIIFKQSNKMASMVFETWTETSQKFKQKSGTKSLLKSFKDVSLGLRWDLVVQLKQTISNSEWHEIPTKWLWFLRCHFIFLYACWFNNPAFRFRQS